MIGSSRLGQFDRHFYAFSRPTTDIGSGAAGFLDIDPDSTMAENETSAAATQQPPPTTATPLQPLTRTLPPVPPSEFGGETNAESVDPSIQAE